MYQFVQVVSRMVVYETFQKLLPNSALQILVQTSNNSSNKKIDPDFLEVYNKAQYSKSSQRPKIKWSNLKTLFFKLIKSIKYFFIMSVFI